MDKLFCEYKAKYKQMLKSLRPQLSCGIDKHFDNLHYNYRRNVLSRDRGRLEFNEISRDFIKYALGFLDDMYLAQLPPSVEPRAVPRAILRAPADISDEMLGWCDHKAPSRYCKLEFAAEPQNDDNMHMQELHACVQPHSHYSDNILENWRQRASRGVTMRDDDAARNKNRPDNAPIEYARADNPFAYYTHEMQLEQQLRYGGLNKGPYMKDLTPGGGEFVTRRKHFDHTVMFRVNRSCDPLASTYIPFWRRGMHARNVDRDIDETLHGSDSKDNFGAKYDLYSRYVPLGGFCEEPTARQALARAYVPEDKKCEFVFE